MAEKISVQIALEGGQEVARQLADIGEAGQKAFADIAASAEQVGGFKQLDPSEVTAKLKNLGLEGSAAFGKIQKAVGTAVKFENIVTGVQSVETALLNLAKAGGVIGAGLAAAFAAMVKPTIAFAEAINKASDQAVKLGLSLGKFRQLQSELEKSGLAGETAAEGLAHFQQQLQKSIEGADPGSQLRLFGNAAKMLGPELEKLKAQLRSMPDGAERTNLAISQLGQNAGTALIQSLRRAEGAMTADEQKAYDLGQAFTQLGNATAKLGTLAFAPALTTGINTATTAVQALNTALGGLQQIGQSGIGQQIGTTLQQSFTGLDQIIAGVAGTIAQAMGASKEQVEAVKQSILGFGQTAQQTGQQAAQGLQLVTNPLTGMPELIQTTNAALAQTGTAANAAGQAAASAANTGSSAWQSFLDVVNSVIEKLLQAVGIRSPGGGGSGATGSFAHGGLIGGRGTGTSDSNLAWLSRGEHIMPARAVAQPGVLSFLEALRRSGGNLRGVLDGLGRFALGGLVPRQAFATGGPVGGMSNVTINFPGTPPIVGLRASAGVVEQLQKAAALAQVRSGGRKPSRYS